MKKQIYRIHKWAGLTLGFLLFLLAVSGVGITFRSELLPLFYSDLFAIEAGANYLPLSTLYEKAATHIGDFSPITNIYSAHDKDEAWIVIYKKVNQAFPMMLTMNPFTGDVVGEMSMIKNFFALMLFLHANFLLGKAGSYLVGVMGLLLVAFVISGIYIWLPVKGAKERLLKTFKLKSLGDAQKSHHAIGIVLAIPLLISAVTGFLTVFDLSYYTLRPLRGEPHRVEELEQVITCSFDEQMNVLRSLPPETPNKLISIHFCTKKNGLMKISSGLKDQDFLEGYERILIDPRTNETVQSFNSDKDPSSWNTKRLFIFPIHSGEYFGTFGKTVNFFTGLGLLILWLTGVRLFIKRKQRKRLPL
jgi:uncharacterized iron-regulated membrane protein